MVFSVGSKISSRLLTSPSSVTVTEQAYLDLTQEDLAELYRRHSPLKNMR